MIPDNIKKETLIIFLLLLMVTIAFTSCEKGIEPKVIKSGRRDYAWRCDTLFIPFTYLERIWGSSPTDVWAVGPGGDKDKILYHYDGKTWRNDGKSRPMTPFALWGFATNDIWAGGFGPLFHYDGIDWQKDFEYKNSELIRYGIQDIWGDSPDNVWAVGFADSSNVRIGIIFHYNGTFWRRVDIGFTRTTMMRIKRGKKTSKNFFIWGVKEDDVVGDTTKLFEFNGKKIKEISSAYNIRPNSDFIQEINNEIIFTKGYKLVKYGGDKKFHTMVNIDDLQFGVQIYGRSVKDIFLRMKNGIAHYDGYDIQYLVKFNGDDNIREGIVFNSEVFFLTNNFNKSLSLIYHGTLK